MLNDYKPSEIKQEKKPIFSFLFEKHPLNSILQGKLTYFLNYLKKNEEKIDTNDYITLKISTLYLKLITCNDKSEFKDILSTLQTLSRQEKVFRILNQLYFYECILYFIDDFEQFSLFLDILLLTWTCNFSTSTGNNLILRLAEYFNTKRVRNDKLLYLNF